MASTNGWTGFKLMDPENSYTSATSMDISREGSISGSSYSGMSSFSGGASSASGSTSTMSTTGTDDQGNEILIALERRSVRPFRTQDEYLYAMKEDLAEWFNALYEANITVDNFFEEIETGALLCGHANAIQKLMKESLLPEDDNPKSYNPRATPVNMADYCVSYRANAKPGTFQSRDNISNFLTWCVRLGIPDNLRFESDDLVLRKHERNVVLCLLEVARRGARYGMPAPTLVQMEQEIDAEIAGREPPPRSFIPVATPSLARGDKGGKKSTEPQVQRQTCDLMSLDEMVRDMVSRCTCPSQFPMVKVSDGKYKIGDSQTLIFVRILRNHVMVRIGGGWDTLEHYLDRHDPCRCHAKGHPQGQRLPRGASPVQVEMARRSSTPNSGLAGLEIKSTFKAKEGAIVETPEEVGFRPVSAQRKTSATSNLSKGTPRSFSPHTTPRKPKRTLPNVPTEVTGVGATNSLPQRKEGKIPQPGSSRNYGSNSATPTPTRSRSAIDRRNSETNPYKQYWKWGSEEELPSDMYSNHRSEATQNGEEVLVISRNDSGGHRIGASQNNNNEAQSSLNNSQNGLQRAFSANRFQITADKLLPSKPKNITRSASQSSEQSSDGYPGAGVVGDNAYKYKVQYSGDSDSYSECGAPTPGSSSGDSSTSTRTGGPNSMTMTWSQGSSQSIDASDFDFKSHNLNSGNASFSLADSEYPEPPPEDSELNKQMERLFQEYRKIERATLERSSDPEGVLRGLNSMQPTPNRSHFTMPKSQKQDFSQVKSKLKDYMTSTTPRRNHTQPHQRRSMTPNPTSGTAHKTPTNTPRRNLPRPPSPASSTSSSVSSHSAFTPIANALKPNIRGVTASPSTTAWRSTRKTSTTDLNNTPTSNRDISMTSRGRQAQQTPSARLRAGSATPRANTPTHQRPVIKDAARSKSKPPVFRPASAPLRRKSVDGRGSEDLALNSEESDSSCGGFLVQSAGAWAANKQDTSNCRSVPQTPVRTPSARSKTTPRKQNSVNTTPTPMRSNSLSSSLRCRSTTCLASTSPEVSLPSPTYHSKDDLITKQKEIEMNKLLLDQMAAAAAAAKSRKDDRSGPRTRIPQPVSRRCKSADPYSTQLKRCDSGVDITNMSPTDVGHQGDEDKIPWVKSEGVALSPQALAQYSPFDDKTEFF